jgi:hypothetical protein
VPDVEQFCKRAGSGVHGKEGYSTRMGIYDGLRDLQVRMMRGIAGGAWRC